MTKRIITFLVTLALFAGAAIVYVQASSEKPTYTITADVAQAPNLFEGGRVMVRGVEVGTIESVEPGPDSVRIEMAIDQDVDVPADARLSIVPITVISDRYVQLYPAYKGGPTIEDGANIPLARTTIPAELDDVLKQLKGLLAALEPRKGETSGPLASLIRNLDETLRGRSDELAGTLKGSADVLENLADSSTDVSALVRNLDEVFVALANRSSEIEIVNERLALVMESLLGDQADLEGTIENVAFFSEQAADLIEDSGNDLGASFGRLAVVLRTVLSHQDELARGIQWANVIAQAAGATDASGRGLYAYSGRQAPVGTEGAKYNYRIDQRDTLACERLRVVGDTVLVILPNATPDDILETLLSFIPPEYQEDITYLLVQLIPECTNVRVPPALGKKKVERIRAVADAIGHARFKKLLARWYFQTYDRPGAGR